MLRHITLLWSDSTGAPDTFFCPTSTVTLLGAHSISGISKHSFVCARPISGFSVCHIQRHTLSDGHMPIRIDQPRFFTLNFQPPSSSLDRGSQSPLLLTRVDLLALIKLELGGVSEYWEDSLAWISAPAISVTFITFFNRVIFDIPQLFRFVSRRGTRVSQASGAQAAQ